MLTLPNITLNAHWLPDDRTEAFASFLALLHSPGKTYIDTFGLNSPEIAEEIITADAHGVVIDINCDHTQSTTPTVRPTLAKISAAFQVSGTGSVITIVASASGHIWHEKSVIVRSTDEGPDWCSTGSTNLTDVAEEEGNSLLIFRSSEYAAAQIAQHIAVAEACRLKHPEWQIGALPAVMGIPITGITPKV